MRFLLVRCLKRSRFRRSAAVLEEGDEVLGPDGVREVQHAVQGFNERDVVGAEGVEVCDLLGEDVEGGSGVLDVSAGRH